MLYIVSTPIGNLKDITQRALDILREVDVIIVESPSDSRRLLNAYEISEKKIIKYNDRNKNLVTDEIIKLLASEDAVYITSAGTPGISDPGVDLVRKARENGIKTFIVPGASSLVSAIAMSGIRAREFTFISFPPKRSGKLRNTFNKYKEDASVLVFFESTHRIIKTITALSEVSPDAYICVAKEMTKMFENYFVGTPEEVLKQMQENAKNVKGEFVVVVDFS